MRRIHCSLVLLLAAGAGTAFAQGTSFFVDAIGGVDAPGGGGVASPFLTIGYALTQPYTSPLTLNLQPGVYASTTNGEIFPIVLPPNVTVKGTTPCGARLDNTTVPPVPGFALRVTLSNSGDACTFQDFQVVGNRSAIRIRSIGSGPHQAIVQRVETSMKGGGSSQSQGILVTSETSLIYQQLECKATDHDRSLTLSSQAPGGQLVAIVDRCHFGTYAPNVLPGISIRAENARDTSLTMLLQNTSFNDRVRGVQTAADPLGTMANLMQHVSARKIGTQVAIGGIGIVDVGGVIEDLNLLPNPALTWQVANCAFFDNTVEIASYSANTHFLTTNLVQDPVLLAAPGMQITGDPLWVDALNDDFHLLPGSPCIDAATILPVAATDQEGDSRTTSCANVPDIGVDETFFWDAYVGIGSGIAKLGSTQSVRFYGDGGSFGFFAYGAPDLTATCTAPKLLTTPTPVFLINALPLPGSPGTRVTATSSILIPSSPSLAGVTVSFGSFFVVIGPGGIPASFNGAELRQVTLCP